MTYVQQHADLDAGRVHYHVGGTGDPVLYLHSAGGMRMTETLERLAERFRVYVLIDPGFDNTPALETVKSMRDLATLAAEFIDKVIGSRTDVIGHSFGGWVATWLATIAPEKVDLLVLEAPAGFRDPGQGGLPKDPVELRKRMFAHPERVPPEQKPADVIARNREMIHHYHGPTSMDADLRARLAGIKSLTLILYGTKDGIIPIDSVRLLKAEIPHAHLLYIYDAAHNIEVDQPERFTEATADFLLRGEAFLVNARGKAAVRT